MPLGTSDVEAVLFLGNVTSNCFGRINLNSGYFGPLINIVDSF